MLFLSLIGLCGVIMFGRGGNYGQHNTWNNLAESSLFDRVKNIMAKFIPCIALMTVITLRPNIITPHHPNRFSIQSHNL